jgi:hypothetical protein
MINRACANLHSLKHRAGTPVMLPLIRGGSVWPYLLLTGTPLNATRTSLEWAWPPPQTPVARPGSGRATTEKLGPDYLPAFLRCTRVRRSNLRCFFFDMRLRRFLITEPMGAPSFVVGHAARRSVQRVERTGTSGLPGYPRPSAGRSAGTPNPFEGCARQPVSRRRSKHPGGTRALLFPAL